MWNFIAFNLGFLLRLAQDFQGHARQIAQPQIDMQQPGASFAWVKEFGKAAGLYMGMLVAGEMVGYLQKGYFFYAWTWAGAIMGFAVIIKMFSKWVFPELREANLILPTVVLWYGVITSWLESSNVIWLILMGIFAIPSAVVFYQLLSPQAPRKGPRADWIRRGLYAWHAITGLAFALQLVFRADMLGHFSTEQDLVNPIHLLGSFFFGAIALQWMAALVILVSLANVDRNHRFKEVREASKVLLAKICPDQIHPGMAVLMLGIYSGTLIANARFRFADEGFILSCLWLIQPFVLKSFQFRQTRSVAL